MITYQNPYILGDIYLSTMRKEKNTEVSIVAYYDISDKPMGYGIGIPVLTCLRCGHKWVPRKPMYPRVCPKCHSPYWNVPPNTIERTKIR